MSALTHKIDPALRYYIVTHSIKNPGFVCAHQCSEFPGGKRVIQERPFETCINLKIMHQTMSGLGLIRVDADSEQDPGALEYWMIY